MMKKILLFVFGLIFLLTSQAIAQDKVVVIPFWVDSAVTPASAPAPVEKTGQTTCYDRFGMAIGCPGTGQDGDLQKGVAWPNPRFTDNSDGTVTDNLTGLIWLKNASCFGFRAWETALSDANTLNSGECGLSDGTVEGEWRLPNMKELNSLIDCSVIDSGITFWSSFYRRAVKFLLVEY